jgi:hypothetical protein
MRDNLSFTQGSSSEQTGVCTERLTFGNIAIYFSFTGDDANVTNNVKHLMRNICFILSALAQCVEIVRKKPKGCLASVGQDGGQEVETRISLSTITQWPYPGTLNQ